MSGAKLPPGQKTHVLHHTLASHSMMSGGKILTLQRVLGHALLNMTLRTGPPLGCADAGPRAPIRDFRHLLHTGEDHEC